MNTDSGMTASGRRLVRARILPALCLLAVLSLCVTTVWPGMQGVPCRNPQVWSGASVNAVVYPYQYAGRDNRPMSEAARELTLLTHMNVLFSMLKYGGVGAVTLTTLGVSPQTLRRECSPEIVMAKILGQQSGAESVIQPKRGVVMLWGFVYEEGDDVYVQSFVRFTRRDDPGRIELEVESSGLDQLKLVGHLTQTAVTFAPQRLTTQTLQAIAGAFRTTAKVYAEPKGSATVRDVGMDPDVQLSYRVTKARPGWMYIESTYGEVKGWIKAEPRVGEQRLDERLPEINFVEGVVGYMRLQMALDGTAEYGDRRSLIGWTQRALQRYEELANGKSAPAPAAMAEILLGNLEILSASPESMRNAVVAAGRHYRRAASIAPDDVTARSMDAMARIYLGHATGWTDDTPLGVASALQDALVLDPTNRDVTANLDTLFSLIRDLPESTTRVQKQELARRTAALRAIRAHQAEQ